MKLIETGRRCYKEKKLNNQFLNKKEGNEQTIPQPNENSFQKDDNHFEFMVTKSVNNVESENQI